MSFKIEDLRDGYNTLWDAVEPIAARLRAIDATIDRLAIGRPRYELVSKITGVPWVLIGALHSMECSLNFNGHLHNGDLIQHNGVYHRTIDVPEGRPVAPPPWTWEASAVDALRGMLSWKDWSVAGCLFQAEGYNGWGYRFHKIHSPYLWGGSNEQQPGKYVSDHVWSATAITDQIGVATLLDRMEDRGIFVFPEDRDTDSP